MIMGSVSAFGGASEEEIKAVVTVMRSNVKKVATYSVLLQNHSEIFPSVLSRVLEDNLPGLFELMDTYTGPTFGPELLSFHAAQDQQRHLLTLTFGGRIDGVLAPACAAVSC